MLALPYALSRRRESEVKVEPFECGNPFRGNPWARFPVKFSTVALLFLLFDVEVVALFLFVYGGVELFREVASGLFFFFFVLGFGFLYALRLRALEWE